MAQPPAHKGSDPFSPPDGNAFELSEPVEGGVDANGVEVMSREECLRLLESVSVARIGLSADALPVVVPVNIAMAALSPDRGVEVIIRTVEGTKLLASLRHAVIAVEADSIEPMSHSGWSVLVRGRSRVIDDPSELSAAEHLPLRPWATSSADRYIGIGLDVVSGRRVVGWHPPPSPPPGAPGSSTFHAD